MFHWNSNLEGGKKCLSRSVIVRRRGGTSERLLGKKPVGNFGAREGGSGAAESATEENTEGQYSFRKGRERKILKGLLE